MVKFDGVSSASNTNGIEYIRSDSNNVSQSAVGEKTIVSGRTNYADGTKVEMTTTEKDKVAAQELTDQLSKDFETLNKLISKGNFSDENWAVFIEVKQSVDDVLAQLDKLPCSSEQEKLIKDARNAIAVYNNSAMRSYLSDDIFYLDNDFYSTGSVTGFHKENLSPVRDAIIAELQSENLTDKEKIVYDFLDKAIAAKTEPSKLPGYDRLSPQLQGALSDAYESSQRDILVDRGDGKKYQKKINQSKTPSLKEKIFWVKNAFDDFALRSLETNDIQTMVNMAVSEYLYDGKQNNTLTLIRDFDKAWMPSLTDVRHKIYDDPQAILTPREEKVWNNYNYAKHHDPDGGVDSSYASTYAAMSIELTGFDPATGKYVAQNNVKPKQKGTITRRRD